MSRRLLSLVLIFVMLFSAVMPMAYAEEITSYEIQESDDTEPGAEEGTETGTEDSAEPGTEEGTEPGTAEGTETGTEEDAEPGTEEDAKPGTEEDAETGTEEGAETGTEEGAEPGTEEGAEPGTEEGAEPGTEEGAEPGTEEGAEPGTEEGAELGTEEDTETDDEVLPVEVNQENGEPSPPSTGTPTVSFDTEVLGTEIIAYSYGGAVKVELDNNDSQENPFILYTDEQGYNFMQHDNSVGYLNNLESVEHLEIYDRYYDDNGDVYKAENFYDLDPETTYYYAIGLRKNVDGVGHVNKIVISDGSFTTDSSYSMNPEVTEHAQKLGHFRSSFEFILNDYMVDVHSGLVLQYADNQAMESAKSNTYPVGVRDVIEPGAPHFYMSMDMTSDTMYYRYGVVESKQGEESIVYFDVNSIDRAALPTAINITQADAAGSVMNIQGNVDGYTHNSDGSYRVYVSESDDFSDFDTSYLSVSQDGTFTGTVDNLTEETTYYAKVVYYYTNNDIVLTSEDVTFTTVVDQVLTLEDFSGNESLYNYTKERYSPSDDLTSSDLFNVTRMNLSESDNVDSLVGLENYSKLEDFSIYNATLLTTLDGIGAAKSLREVSVSGAALTDISDLATLDKLIALSLRECQLTSLDGIENLVTLVGLNVSQNNLTSLPDLTKLVNLSPGEMLDDHYQMDTYFTQNDLADYLNETYLPQQLLTDRWLFENLRSQSEATITEMLVPSEFYNVDGQKVFFAEVNNTSMNEHKITLTIGDVSKTYTMEGSYRNKYYTNLNLETDFPGLGDTVWIQVSVEDTVKDEIVATADKDVSFVEMNAWLDPSYKYLSNQDKSHDIGVVLLGEYDYLDFSNARLMNQDNEIVSMAVEDFIAEEHTHISHNADERYLDDYSYEARPQVPTTHLYMEVFDNTALEVGTYDLVFEVNGQETTIESSIVVTDNPIIKNINQHVSDFPDAAYGDEDMYLYIRGTDIDPSDLQPVLHDLDKQKVASTESFRQLDGTSFVYKLVRDALNWPINLIASVESKTNQAFASLDSDNKFNIYRYDRDIYYVELNPYNLELFLVTDKSIGDVTVSVLDDFNAEAIATATGNIKKGENVLELTLMDDYQFESNMRYEIEIQADGRSYREGVYLNHLMDDNYTNNPSFENVLIYSDTIEFDIDGHILVSDGNTDVSIKLLKGEEVILGPIPTEQYDLRIDGQPYKGFRKSITLDNPLDLGSYTLEYHLTGDVNEVITRKLEVFDTNQVYVGWTSDSFDNGRLEISFNCGSSFDMTKVSADIKDVFGNAVTGWTGELDRNTNNEQRYTYIVTGLPTDVYYLVAKLTYDGQEIKSTSDPNMSLYEENSYYSRVEVSAEKNYGYLNTGSSYYVITGVYGPSADYPLTLNFYKPYEVEATKSMVVSESGEFIKANFAGMDLNRLYDVEVLNKNGESVNFRNDVRIIAKDGQVVSVTGVQVTPATVSLEATQTATLGVSVLPIDATNKHVTWTTSDEEVATVSSTGLVTGISEGTAIITAKTSDGDFTDTCTVTVIGLPEPVTGVTLDQSELTLFVGNTETLTETVSPSDAADKSVVWSSSDEAVATVKDGKVTAISSGHAVITVKTVDGDFTATCDVTVITPIDMTISLTYNDDTVIEKVNGGYIVDGAKFPVYEEAFEEETNLPLKMTVTGTGSEIEDETQYKVHATFNDKFEFEALQPGSKLKEGLVDTIIRSADLVDGEYPLKVKLYLGDVEKASYTYNVKIEGSIVNVTGVAFDQESVTLSPGKTYQLKPIIAPDNATNKNVTYTSSDETVMTVSETGLVTGLGAGTAKVIATSEHRAYTAEMDVHVNVQASGSLDLTNMESRVYYVELLDSNNSVVAVKYLDAQNGFKFYNLGLGDYRVRISGPMGYASVDEAFTVAKGDTQVDLGQLSFESIYKDASTVSVNLSNSDDTAYDGRVDVSLYDYESRLYYSSNTIENGVVTFNNVRYTTGGSSYSISVNAGNYTNHATISVDKAEVSVDVEVPLTYSVSGKVLLADGSPLAYTSLNLYGNSEYYYGYTNEDGDFTIYGVLAGDYELDINKSEYILTEKNVAIVDDDVTLTDITVSKGIDLIGRVSSNGQEPYKAYVTLYKDDNFHSSTTAGEGGFIFTGAIKEAGDYKLVLGSLHDKQYRYKPFIADPVEFTVSEEDITDAISQGAGRISKDLLFEYQTNGADSFVGQGNEVLVDRKLVQEGNDINLVVKYKNQGNVAKDATFKVELPTGITTSEALNTSVTVDPGKDGMISLPLKIGKLPENYASIVVSVEVDGQTYDFGATSVEKQVAKLNGPESVKTNDVIKVYGEATANSEIVIKDIETGKIYSTTKPNGRWFNASLSFDEIGTYNIVAVVTVDGVSEISEPLTIEVSADPLELVSVMSSSAGTSVLPTNPLIGVRAFTAWVDYDLNGRDIIIESEFDKDIISFVTYHFSDNDYQAKKMGDFYVATLKDWSGSGLKTITATVETNDGRTLEYIIAEVTVLIDPSGYVEDAETGSRLEGVTVICEVFENDTWSEWNAALYGQINPQITNEEGEYGWMVPAGTYRVKAVKDGYEPYITTEDERAHIKSIVIPPVRTDVNFELEPSIRVTSLTIEEDTLALKTGETKEISYTVNPDDATNKDNVTLVYNDDFIKVINKGDGLLSVQALKETSGQNLKVKVGDLSDDISIVIEKGSVVDPGDNDDDDDDDDDDEDDDNSGSKTVNIPSKVPSASTKVEKNSELKLNYKGLLVVAAKALKEMETLNILGDVEINLSKLLLDSLSYKKNLQVEVKAVEEIPASIKSFVKSDKIYDITMKLDGKIKDSFDTKMTMEIPYELGKNEDANAIVVYHIHGDKIETIFSQYIDGKVVFKTKSLSQFAIGYHPVEFTDNKGWFEDYVTSLASNGIISGKGEGQFVPNADITRAEVLQVLYNMNKGDKTYVKSSFKDVDEKDWYFQAVEWGYQNGLVSGRGDMEFAPNTNISRQDLALILVNYQSKIASYDFDGFDHSGAFSDHSKIASYAKEAVYKLKDANIISGRGKNMFEASGSATRAECAAIIYKLLGL
ncbi:hypothetical protein EZV73_22090 [Acidaminobacter sp. JC074]|uniref:Ig-like domain-containing protein n=1 Tax=Acidaminobacter sp. JC074 TaxID=2530199 RepID=UPI001F0E9A8D|nr:Ig-like domain-containing protein [Acidaminobacter sp. JC074]MCH4890289.1 hypothetical protein [Acidaminobacter sp. JC074]